MTKLKAAVDRLRRLLDDDEDDYRVWPDDNGLKQQGDFDEVARAVLALANQKDVRNFCREIGIGWSARK